MIVIIRNLVRVVFIQARYAYLKYVFGMNISKTARVSLGTKLDKTNPAGINIGDDSYLASGVLVLTHDYSRSIKTNTYIGKKCFIGANAIIMPGVIIGDEVIIGSGSVVTRNIPSYTIAAGNPCKVIKSGIKTNKYGRLKV